MRNSRAFLRDLEATPDPTMKSVTVEGKPPEPPPAEGAPAAEPEEGEEAEGFGNSDELMDSVTKDEWKTIEQALSYTKKTVSEMLKRACAQVSSMPLPLLC